MTFCASRCKLRTCYVTDIEGDMKYFLRFLEHPKCPLEFKSLEFKDNSTKFVFGGDLFDHGEDLCLGHTLLDLKERYPERVHFILGNRDVNKMVLPWIEKEISTYNLSEAESTFFGLTRDDVSDELKKLTTKKTLKKMTYRDFLHKEGIARDFADPISYLKWALEYKMGAGGTFERRRNEIEGIIANNNAASVSDAEVASTFFDAAKPGGIYYEYIKHASLMKVIDSVCFVHGGITDENVGFLPLSQVKYNEQEKVGRRFLEKGVEFDQWYASLESFRNQQVEMWLSNTGDRGDALRMCGIPKYFAPYSVIVGSFIESEGPSYASLPVVQYLLTSGISTVCSGHQPCGDSPIIVRQPGGFTMIDADNSYCGRIDPTKENNRDSALNLVFFEDDGTCTIEGFKSDGSPFVSHFSCGTSDTEKAAKYLGREVGDGWWTKGSFIKTDVSGKPVFYNLSKTLDGYRHEEKKVLSYDEVEGLVVNATLSTPGRGVLKSTHTTDELKEVFVHRIKTKVQPKE